MINEFFGHTFLEPRYLENALTHSSLSNEKRLGYEASNERLEFLGDAVVELTMSEYLYNLFPNKTEGDLTRLRAGAVCEATLARVAKAHNVGSALLIGKGEEATGGRERDSTLADAFEAIIGAIFLDGGFEVARAVVTRILENEANAVDITSFDNKTYLQEFLQRTSASPITYTVIKESGPDHEKIFTVSLTYEGKELAQGHGKSKKEAEQSAAASAIDMLGAREA